ncbi:unnamed protein product, partial [Amoebophrya sp. A25]
GTPDIDQYYAASSSNNNDSKGINFHARSSASVARSGLYNHHPLSFQGSSSLQ